MSTMTKVFVVLTSVLTITVSTLFVAAAAQWSNWRDLAEKYRMERDAAITERMNAQASTYVSLAIKDDALAEAQRALAEANRRVQDQMDANAKLKSDLARVDEEKMSAEAARTSLEGTLAVTINERASLQEHNRELFTENTELQTRNTRLNARVLELTANVTILTDELRNLQEKNYAYEQRIAQLLRGEAGARPEGEPAAEAGTARVVRPAVKGAIDATVTRVDGTYASISAGEASGVAQGMEFMLVRDGSYLGSLLIDVVRPKEAGGRLTLVDGREVRAGDLARWGLEND